MKSYIPNSIILNFSDIADDLNNLIAPKCFEVFMKLNIVYWQ